MASSRHRSRGKRGPSAWAGAADEELLALRFRELGLRLEGTWLEDVLAALRRDLERRGLAFRPHVWLGAEWFSPLGVPGFSVPFYLAHPRLMRLERRLVHEVEGGTRAECLAIMRHECGHAIQHAYRLHRRPEWQRRFGRSSRAYPAFYRPLPDSRDFVQHLRLYYAQSHPDEDFAETFAVWLQPRERWRRRYAGWPALAKLEYVDRLMATLEERPPAVRSRKAVEPLGALDATLKEHYDAMRAHYAPRYPRVYDRELRQLFSDDPRHRRRELAASFLRRHRAAIQELIARWLGGHEFTLELVLDDMIGRCRQLKLRVAGQEPKLLGDFAVLLTARTVQVLHGRRRWIPL
ncbi:MAG TPA: hypothetical protein VFD43_02330 [Planctomycetota bacterium]|nr:hypothetical protein [Planctomycetota bacterium]